mgnify:CR=1 FL=1
MFVFASKNIEKLISLFSLLYETNIGVFYDQLAKQMQPKGISLSYHTKTSGGFTADSPNKRLKTAL